MDRTTLDLLLLIVATLLGLSLGSLLRGLGRSRSAEAAQARAYAQANRLARRFRHEARWYARRGRQVAGFLFLGAVGTWVALWLGLGAVPIPALDELIYLGAGILMAAVVGLFPLVGGGLLVAVLIFLRLAFGAANDAWVAVADPGLDLPVKLEPGANQGRVEAETLTTSILYRPVIAPLSYRLVPSPDPGSPAEPSVFWRVGLWLRGVLPGVSYRRLAIDLPADAATRAITVQLVSPRELVWQYRP